MIRTLTSEQKAELIEGIAELEHEQWCHWSQATATLESIDELIKETEHWKIGWVNYQELNEEVKEFHRVWARKVLKVFEELNMEVVSK